MNKLEVLFPEREVIIKLGEVEIPVLVSPLSLEDLPKVAKAFGRLMELAEGKVLSNSELAAKGLEELLLLVPYCIDLPPNRVPASQVPDILEVVVEQNITDEIVGKWMGLVQKLVEKAGLDMDSIKKLGETALKKK